MPDDVRHPIKCRPVEVETRPPDADQMRRFYGAIFRHADPGSIVSLPVLLVTKPKGKSAVIASLRHRFRGIEALVEESLPLAVTASAGSGDESKVFAPRVATFHPKQREKAAGDRNVACGLAVALDFDAGDPPASVRRLTDILGEPTLVVSSGGTIVDTSTGEILQKLHVYWRLAIPTRTPEEHDRLGRLHALLAAATGGSADSSSKSIGHPMRLPGSWHTKDPLRPVLCRIVGGDPEREIDLHAALAIAEKAARDYSRREDGGPAGSLRRVDLAAPGDTPEARIEALRRALPLVPYVYEDTRSGYPDFLKVGMALDGATGGDPAARELWVEWYLAKNEADLLAGGAPEGVARSSPEHRAADCRDRWDGRIRRSKTQYLGWPSIQKWTGQGTAKRVRKPLDRVYADWVRDQVMTDCGIEPRKHPDTGAVEFYHEGLWQPIRKLWGKRLMERFEDASGVVVNRALDVSLPLLLEDLPSKAPRDDLIHTPEGVLDIRTMELLPHSPHHFLRYSAGVSYRQDTSRDLLRKFLSETFVTDIWEGEDDRTEQERTEDVGLMTEACMGFLGICLTTYMGAQKFLTILGPAGSGKGTVSKLLSRMIPGVCRSVNIEQMADPRHQRSILNAAVNISSEAPEGFDTKAWDFIKEITGQDDKEGRALYQEAVKVEPVCRLIFLNNELFRARDPQGAIGRRALTLVAARGRPNDDQRDATLQDRLLANREATFAEMVEAAHRAFKRGGDQGARFTTPHISRYLNARSAVEGDTVLAFLEGGFLEEAGAKDAWLSTEELHRYYVQWAREAAPSSRPVSEVKFGATLTRTRPAWKAQQKWAAGRNRMLRPVKWASDVHQRINTTKF